MLSAVVDHGTARAARGSVKGSAIAGKTGTSRDGWFVGYTPNLVCAVWIGFDDNKQLGLTGAAAALPAWTDFMKSAVARKPELGGRTFECPEGIKFVEIDNDTGMISTLTCPHRELIAIREGSGPNLECFIHGNLPPSKATEDSYSPALPTAEARQRVNPAERIDPSKFRSTRVEVDNKGKRTLVNEMR
jgi:penicillin-binding protein 1B